MDIIKKNIISVICGVVALAAIVVAFFVVPSRAGELQSKLAARKTVRDEMASLLSKPRDLPAPDASDPTPKPLNRFPSPPIIKQGEAIIGQLEKESVQLREAAVAMNRHELLVKGALPRPNQVQAYEFRNAYQRALPLPLPNQPAQPGQPTALNSVFAKALKAGMPPTPDLIAQKLQERADEIRQKESFLLPSGQIGNLEALNLRIAELQQKLPAQLREEVANTSRIYISPDTFEIYPRFASVAGAPSDVDIYFAQLSYWIQQDVVNAINDINANAKNVLQSPVKHLQSVRVKSAGIPTFMTAADGTSTNDPDGALPVSPMTSPTGRVCNGLYDVFHFTLVADVEAEKLPDFLRGLGYKRFITPMSVDIKALDIATTLAQGRLYGDKPMLNVTVECEILYMRKWNAPFMPAAIRTRLGITDDPSGAAPGTAIPAAGQQPPDEVPAGVPLPGDPIPGMPAPAQPAAPPPAPAEPAADVPTAGDAAGADPAPEDPAAGPNTN
jgi:hypothetical protein